MKYLLRVEAVNLYNFVYDTNKIQPMRGGGYLLLESVDGLAGQTVAGAKLTKISTGASIGLFEFSSPDPTNVCKAVLDQLNMATGGHATFVVDHVQATDGSFEEDLQNLMAKNRWKQYQQPTLVLPLQSAKEECSFDGLRPGIVETKLPENKIVLLSDSVDYRKAKGKSLKKTIYQKILLNDIKGQGNAEIQKLLDSVDFVDDLHELAGVGEDDKKQGNLKDKIAFIYLDGNKFTKARTKHCKEATKLGEFSEAVERPRKAFLKELLSLTDEDFFTKSGEMRLETLLWGGDELEIIVPAWKGFKVLELLYMHLATSEFAKQPLTYSGGVIFCNNKAPILQLRSMVHELADDVKKSIGEGPQKNSLRMLVMESFDTLGTSVSDFATSYYGEDIWQTLLLDFQDIANIKDTVKSMKDNDFPRNKMFDIARGIKSGNVPNESFNAACKGSTDQTAVREVLENFLGVKSKTQNDKKDPVYGDESLNGFRRWFLLNELWDYVEGGEIQ